MWCGKIGYWNDVNIGKGCDNAQNWIELKIQSNNPKVGLIELMEVKNPKGKFLGA